MKIAYASDIHLEFSDIILNNTENAKVLILAGDIIVADNLTEYKPDWMSFRSEQIYNFFFQICKEFETVIYVCGNHENYYSDIEETILHLKKCLNKTLFPNLHISENEYVDIDDVRFICGTLWTDMNNNDIESKHLITRRMTDFRVIGNAEKVFSPDDAIEKFQETKEFIFDTIKNTHDKKIVVITHHQPSFRSVSKEFKYDIKMNGGYCSSLDVEIENSNIHVWIAGHVHSSWDYFIGNTRILVNSRGYLGEISYNKFELKYFEI